MLINISTNPREDLHYDLSLPIVFARDKKTNSYHSKILEIFSDIDHNAVLFITDNGGPPNFVERVVDILRSNGYKNVYIDSNFDYEYFSQKSQMFSDPKRPFLFFDITPIKDDIEKIIDLYKSKTWKIDVPDEGITGHYHPFMLSKQKTPYAVESLPQQIWTQIQPDYNRSTTRNPELMDEFFSLMPKIQNLLTNICNYNQMDIENLNERITLRIIEYTWQPPKQPQNFMRTFSPHIDNSLMTGILFQSVPGLYVHEFVNEYYISKETNPIDVRDRLFNNQGIIFPGNIFFEEFKTWIPALWHDVKLDYSDERRISFVIRIEPKSEISLKEQAR